MEYASIHVYKKRVWIWLTGIFRENRKFTTRTVIGSHHDLLSITAGTVIRFATVILRPDIFRAITSIGLIRFDAHFLFQLS